MQFVGILLLTFRELWARKITVGLFVISTLAWVILAFALNLDIVDGALAGLRIFGQSARAGAVTDPESGDVARQALSLERVVFMVEAFVSWLAYWIGILLGLFATASLLPGMLERGRVDLLLSKPIGRARLLAGEADRHRRGGGGRSRNPSSRSTRSRCHEWRSLLLYRSVCCCVSAIAALLFFGQHLPQAGQCPMLHLPAGIALFSQYHANLVK